MSPELQAYLPENVGLSQDQQDLFNDLLAAVGGDFRPMRRDSRKPATYVTGTGISNVAVWLYQQTHYDAADRLAVAEFWGGAELRDELGRLLDVVQA